jgi:hypothetical protein
MSALGHKRTFAVQKGMSALRTSFRAARPLRCRLKQFLKFLLVEFRIPRREMTACLIASRDQIMPLFTRWKRVKFPGKSCG